MSFRKKVLISTILLTLPYTNLARKVKNCDPLYQDYSIQWDNSLCPSLTSYMNNLPKWVGIDLESFEDNNHVLVHIDTYAQVCSQDDFKADNFGGNERVVLGNLPGDVRSKNSINGTDATAEAIFSIKYNNKETERGTKKGLESLHLTPSLDAYLVSPIAFFHTIQDTSISLSLTARELPLGIQEGSGTTVERHVDKGQKVLRKNYYPNQTLEEVGHYSPGASWAAPNQSYDWSGSNTHTPLADTSGLTTIDKVEGKNLETIVFNSSDRTLVFKITEAVEKAIQEKRDLTIDISLTNPEEYRNTGKPCGFIIMPSSESPYDISAYIALSTSRPSTKTFIK